jgi:very-short-patch-repair endonuclease
MTTNELIMYSDDINNYFIGNEIVNLINFKNTSSTLKEYVSDENKILFKDFKGKKEPYQDPRTILITHDGFVELVEKTCQTHPISEEVEKILYKYDIEIAEKQELTTYSYINNHMMFEYFVGFEIVTLIGYKNVAQAIKNVSKSNQLLFHEFPGPKIPKLDPRTILLTREGVCEILIKTRKRLTEDVELILKKFQIETTNKKCLTKEQQTLSAIANAFKTEKIEDQYSIGTYFLDLYFTELKIIIECDENGHADRKPCNERTRMDYVNKQLNIDDSNWIRYNPDEYDFDISKVIGKIYCKIEECKKNKYLNMLEDSSMRKCIKCAIQKPLIEENYGKRGRGFNITCKNCIGSKKEESKLIKKCTKCLKELQLTKFYKKSKKQITENTPEIDKYRIVCISCSDSYSKERKKQLLSNPLLGKKECTKCEEILRYDMFYIDPNVLHGNESDKLYNICQVCYKEENGKNNKQCRNCYKILKYNNFHKDLDKPDGVHTFCKECRNKLEKNKRSRRGYPVDPECRQSG